MPKSDRSRSPCRKPAPKPMSLGLPPLQERVFLVTGATDGIGKFTAEQLAKLGCTLIVHGRNPAKVEELVADLHKQTPKVHGFTADLSLVSEVQRLGQEVS